MNERGSKSEKEAEDDLNNGPSRKSETRQGDQPCGQSSSQKRGGSGGGGGEVA